MLNIAKVDGKRPPQIAGATLGITVWLPAATLIGSHWNAPRSRMSWS